MRVDEMEEVLHRLGMEPISITGPEIRSFCPGHLEIKGKEDSNPSWYINADTGAHICFSCGFRGGLLYLIAYVNKFKDASGNLDYAEARDWFYSENADLTSMFEKIEKKEAEKQTVFKEVTEISEARLAIFTDPPAHALTARGFTVEASKKYEVLWDPKHNNWITPIRNPFNNELMGWQEKGYEKRFFRNYPNGVEKSKALFGFNRYLGGRLIVVESPLDVVRLESVGVSGGVATFGALASKDQINLIRGADQVVFAFDNDEAGRLMSTKMLKYSAELMFEAWFFNYSHTDMKDVGGMSKAEILNGLDTAKHSLHGLGAIS